RDPVQHLGLGTGDRTAATQALVGPGTTTQADAPGWRAPTNLGPGAGAGSWAGGVDRDLLARGRSRPAHRALRKGAGASRSSRLLAERTAPGGMALDRVAGRRERAHQVLALDPAGGHQLRAPGRTRQAPVAHRARLPGAQAGTRTGALRGPRLARFPPSRDALHRSLWLPDRRTGEDFPLRIGRPEAQSDWPSHG